MRGNIHVAVSFAITVAVTSVAVGAGGCVAPDESEPTATVYRTIVRFSPDGTVEPTFQTVTVAEQQAELAARAAAIAALRTGGETQALPTLKVDGGCAGSSLWLFDQANLGGNELCLFKAPADDMAWLDLGTLCRTPTRLCATWANAVRSLWAGTHPGSLQSCTATLCFTMPFLNFTPFQRINSVAAGAPHPLNWGFLFTP